MIAPSGIVVGELLDEDGAALAQLLDHVLVVDDLLAHVHRRAVELERALDRLHRAVDAGAVAAGAASRSFSGAGTAMAPWYESRAVVDARR